MRRRNGSFGKVSPAQLHYLKQGFVPLSQEQIGGGASAISSSQRQWVSPAERAAVMAWATEYEALANEIDRRYEVGQVEGVEDLEQRAYALEEALEHTLEEFATAEADLATAEDEKELQNLEDQVAETYHQYLHPEEQGYDRFAPGSYIDAEEGRTTREAMLAYFLRGQIAHMASAHGREGRDPAKATDQELLAAAEDVYRRKLGLLARYKGAKKFPARPRIPKKKNPHDENDPGWLAILLQGDLFHGQIEPEAAAARVPALEAAVTDQHQAQEVQSLKRAIERAIRLRGVLAQLAGARAARFVGPRHDLMIHPTPRPDAKGKLQVTSFDKSGVPWGHHYSKSGDLLDAVKEAWRDERGELELVERANPEPMCSRCKVPLVKSSPGWRCEGCVGWWPDEAFEPPPTCAKCRVGVATRAWAGRAKQLCSACYQWRTAVAARKRRESGKPRKQTKRQKRDAEERRREKEAEREGGMGPLFGENSSGYSLEPTIGPMLVTNPRGDLAVRRPGEGRDPKLEAWRRGLPVAPDDERLRSDWPAVAVAAWWLHGLESKAKLNRWNWTSPPHGWSYASALSWLYRDDDGQIVRRYRVGHVGAYRELTTFDYGQPRWDEPGVQELVFWAYQESSRHVSESDRNPGPDERARALERSGSDPSALAAELLRHGRASELVRHPRAWDSAMAMVRAGQYPEEVMPLPPWVDRRMTAEEILAAFERARGAWVRVEATYRPGWGHMLGKVVDWPSSQVDGYMRVRFYVGRSTGEQPVLLQLHNQRSTGGDILDPKHFVHARLMREVGGHIPPRWKNTPRPSV